MIKLAAACQSAYAANAEAEVESEAYARLLADVQCRRGSFYAEEIRVLYVGQAQLHDERGVGRKLDVLAAAKRQYFLLTLTTET